MMEATIMKIDWENIKTAGSQLLKTRENVLAGIMENLVRSGILLPAETSEYRDSFSRYDWNELIQILDESNRQQAEYVSVIG